jgi:hypothetical protein
MSTAESRVTPGIRHPQDPIAELLRHLDRHCRIARRRGNFDLATDLREACRFLRIMKLDEEEARHV